MLAFIQSMLYGFISGLSIIKMSKCLIATHAAYLWNGIINATIPTYTKLVRKVWPRNSFICLGANEIFNFKFCLSPTLCVCIEVVTMKIYAFQNVSKKKFNV